MSRETNNNHIIRTDDMILSELSGHFVFVVTTAILFHQSGRDVILIPLDYRSVSIERVRIIIGSVGAPIGFD